jgi:hypothetical protein
MPDKKPEPLMVLGSARGVYIPRDFAQMFEDRAKQVYGVKDEDWLILEAGPDHEHYWDAWSDVEQKALITHLITKINYTVYQDGDCWLIPVGMEWNDETDWFVWPKEQDNEA